MNNKSYLKKIILEEHKNLTTKSIESIIREEYEKIILEQDEEVIKINKDNWKEWWDNDNNSKSNYEPKVNAVSYADDGLDLLIDEFTAKWAGNEADVFKKSPAAYVDLAESFVKYLGKSPQVTRQGKVFLDPETIDAPPLKITSRSLLFTPDGKVKIVYSLGGQRVERLIEWFIDTDPNGVDVINLNMSRNQEERTYIGSLYNVNGSVVIKKQDEISYANYTLDRLQTFFDWGGLAPLIGVPIDVINTAIYVMRGRWGSAIFSAIAIIPFFGDALRSGSKGIRKIIKQAGISTSRYNRLARGIWARNLDSINEFYSMLLKNDDIVKQLVGPRGSMDDAIDYIRKSLDEVAENQKKLQDWLKSDKMLIPDALEDSMRVATKRFGSFINDNISVLQNFKQLSGVQKRFSLKPDFEFLTSIPPEKLGVMSNLYSKLTKTTSAITRMKPNVIFNVGAKLAARIGIARYTFGASEASLALVRKVFGPLYKPELIKPIEQAYTKLVIKNLTKNPDIMATIAQNMPKSSIDAALGGAQQVKSYVARYFKDKGFKFTGNVDEIEKTLMQTDFWTSAEIVDQLKDVVTIGTKQVKKGEALLEAASLTNNPAFNAFFRNKQWQYESLFNRNIRFLYGGTFKTKTAAFIKEYMNLKKNLFGRKSLDIWWNEWTELASTLGLTPTESANPDSVIIPILFGMIDVSTQSGKGATRKALTTSNQSGVVITALLDKYFKTIRDFANIFPGSQQLSNRLYKYIFTDRIQQILRNPDGSIRIPAFRIDISTYRYLRSEAEKRYGETPQKTREEIVNMMKVFDEEFWNKLDPEVQKNLASLREEFENALTDDQRVINYRDLEKDPNNPESDPFAGYR